ncbi:MAG TPA: CmcI family methyltransferase [Thermoanaerobaculia bacterium]|nr:CmcI family methyltransferase [Thermoanaerobaculia bacterium]
MTDGGRRGEEEARIVRDFHRLYFDGPAGEGRVHHRTTWMGVPCLKTPLDLWMYQEILFETRPALVVETGSHKGGSALFLANALDAIGSGEIVSVDVLADPGRPSHPRIRWVTGSSADPRVVDPIFEGRDPAERRVVILDSDHSRAHVLAELALLAPRVAPGGRLIVEDTNVNGHPVLPEHGPGPWEAVEEFLARNREWERDRSSEKFLLTYNPGGYLRRRA